jgi:hypothetical protein
MGTRAVHVAHGPPGYRARTQLNLLASAYDAGCVKTPQARKPGEWVSQIAQIRPRSEIVIFGIGVALALTASRYLRHAADDCRLFGSSWSNPHCSYRALAKLGRAIGRAGPCG